jgi:mono/diheme cytochrome c family protein
MRRLLPLIALVLVLAGCGGGKTASPTAEEVVGKVPTAAKTVSGDPKAGAKLFDSQGCSGCHTFKPAGSNAKVGPDLDKLAQYAKQANQGSLAEFTQESIVNPGAYVQPSYPNSMPDFGQSLSDTQVADLVAYLTQKQG